MNNQPFDGDTVAARNYCCQPICTNFMGCAYAEQCLEKEKSTPHPPYHLPARLARTALQTAIAEATALLPPALIKIHWMAAKHSPAPWRSVEAHCIGHASYDPAVVAIITDLKLLSEALANLVTILTEPTTTGSTKVAKVRRVEL